MTERAGLRALAFLRAALGVWLIWLALPNLDHSFIDGLPGTLDRFAQENPYPLVRWGIHNVAAPHLELLGTMLSVGQLLVGAALTIGFLTPPVACLGALYAITFLLTAGHLSFAHQGLGVMLLLAFTTLVFADAGQFYGVDGMLFAERSPAKAKSKKPQFKNKKHKAAVEALAAEVGRRTGKKKRPKAGASVD